MKKLTVSLIAAIAISAASAMASDTTAMTDEQIHTLIAAGVNSNSSDVYDMSLITEISFVDANINLGFEYTKDLLSFQANKLVASYVFNDSITSSIGVNAGFFKFYDFDNKEEVAEDWETTEIKTVPKWKSSPVGGITGSVVCNINEKVSFFSKASIDLSADDFDTFFDAQIAVAHKDGWVGGINYRKTDLFKSENSRDMTTFFVGYAFNW
ncbi:hypothetical protein RZR97_00805 [Hydrogenimonas thermophila]|uniref:hypothetical protein n=1 Tax=Hydrogenimonas thermophila TaxID=223786 RepID=UPI0029374A00|nr:hypothetical protein [Hydrogenimonas thermophila]WOE70135.1 hypothetical protein RZR91_00805 [Hydrogenimonas thermophila]WOE72652.1 hypothetical protein RZR97_00805 [Hydrogenimonas thermophila]